MIGLRWKKAWLIAWMLLLPLLGAAALSISPGDVRIEESPDGGFFLYIRAVDGVQSVLIVESTEHPERAAASYALRDPDYHHANAGEQRILDGELLEETRGQSLVSSTVRSDDELGRVFRVFVPYVTVYGYPWSRSGELSIEDGTYLNLRTFELSHADYSGAFQDNPFVIRVTQQAMSEQTTPPQEDGPFLPLAEEAFQHIAEETNAVLRRAATPEEMTVVLRQLFEDIPRTDLDIVIVLDTTQSMHPYMPELQQELIPLLQQQTADFPNWRIGIVFFRDYLEEYVVRKFDFSNDFTIIQNSINRAVARGGRDIPEAVYEGLYTALTGFEWEGDERRIVLIGDAPPHARPRGHVTPDMVFEEIEELGVNIHPVLVVPY